MFLPSCLRFFCPLFPNITDLLNFFYNSKVTLKLRKNNLSSFLAILGLQPRDKAAMLGVKTKEYFLEEFT